MARGVQAAHEDACSILRYSDENSLACALSLAYYSARRSHTVVREMPAGKGFAYLVLVPRPRSAAPAMVLELKRDASATDALAQIRERGYARALAGQASEAVLVGIAYDGRAKEHSCRMERVML